MKSHKDNRRVLGKQLDTKEFIKSCQESFKRFSFMSSNYEKIKTLCKVNNTKMKNEKRRD